MTVVLPFLHNQSIAVEPFIEQELPSWTGENHDDLQELALRRVIVLPGPKDPVAYLIWTSQGRSSTSEKQTIHVIALPAAYLSETQDNPLRLIDYVEYPFVMSDHPGYWSQGKMPTVVAAAVKHIIRSELSVLNDYMETHKAWHVIVGGMGVYSMASDTPLGEE